MSNSIYPVKKFSMGKRFRVYRTLAYILVSVVVFGFFFIYDYLLEGSGLPLNTAMLAAIFVLIEVVLMYAIYKGSNWIQRVYYYEVDGKGLTIVMGKNRKTYTWDQFQAVEMGMYSFVDLCPVKYTINGQKIVFSQYLERNWELHLEIFRHISNHVEISEDLYTQVKAMAL